MSGRLRTKESPGCAAQRVCRWHVDKALASLKNSDQPEAVHSVRKEIKKMRSIFRLARGCLGKSEYQKVAKVMRLAAKPLAASRDARVTKNALETLAGKKASRFPEVKAALDKHSGRAERNFQDHDSGGLAKYLLKKVCDQLESLDFNGAGWAEIRPCLEKSYARGRDAYQAAMLKPTPEHFHEWRKQVKAFWYQLDFLCSGWPKRTKQILDQLEELGDELGDDHDLVLLDQFAKEQCEEGKEATELQRLIDAKRKEYGAGARRLGSRLYADMPKAVCERLEEDWKTWRKSP